LAIASYRTPSFSPDCGRGREFIPSLQSTHCWLLLSHFFHNFYKSTFPSFTLRKTIKMNDFIIIPAHHEQNTIARVIQQAKQYTPNIIVVDDGSSDLTCQEAQQAGALVLQHKVNLGKGAALKTGCEYAIQQGAQRLVVMDADGQHDPKEIPSFLTALNQYDIAFGTRQVPQSMPFVFKVGNTFINKSLQLFYGIKIGDSQCGYRAFTAQTYPKIRWDATNYYVETEMIIKAGKKQLKHIQVPIETIYADKYKGTTVLGGVLIVAKMIGGRLW